MAGHRGNAGELTARVPSGDASRWTGLRRVRVRFGDGTVEEREVEASRAYRDRLVLKLAGIDDAGDAERLRGATLEVDRAEAPELPEGMYWLNDLLGRTVVDEVGDVLGAVEDVVETGGGEVLVVAGGPDGRDEILIPLVRRFVEGIEETTGRLRVRLPEDLRDLNRNRAT